MRLGCDNAVSEPPDMVGILSGLGDGGKTWEFRVVGAGLLLQYVVAEKEL